MVPWDEKERSCPDPTAPPCPGQPCFPFTSPCSALLRFATREGRPAFLHSKNH